MPVIINTPPDPTDLVIQGEGLRSAALSSGIGLALAPLALVMLLGGIATPMAGLQPLVQGEQSYAPTVGGYPVPPMEILRSPDAGSLVYNNAVIATPCGALYPHEIGRRMMNSFGPLGGSNLWGLVGVTRDSGGVALGSCAVIAVMTEQMVIGGAPIMWLTTSDGSGNFTTIVPREDKTYQILAYKAATPVAGIGLNTLVPVSVG